MNDEVPEERRVSFRIGVHVGEAMVRSGDLFGDAVNITARIQGLAKPGWVCLSGAAYEYVRTTLPLDFEDLGAQHVKNFLRRQSAPTWRGPRVTRYRGPFHRSIDARNRISRDGSTHFATQRLRE